MQSLNERHKRIVKKVYLNKLPFKVSENQFREFVATTTHIFLDVFREKEKNKGLKWCFSTIKKAKVFLKIFESNYLGTKMYKEKLSKSLPEYSYKTIANIIDEGIEKGFFVELQPRLQNINDKKIKNLRPSEEIASAFINWYIKIISNIDKLIKKKI